MIGGVQNFEAMFGTSQKRHEARRLHDHLDNAVAFGLQPSVAFLDLLRALQNLAADGRARRSGVAVRLVARGLQIGDVGRVLKQQHDFAVPVEHRRMGGAPQTFFIDWPPIRARAQQRESHRRQMIPLAQVAGPLQRCADLAYVLRSVAARSGVERFEHGLSDDLVAGHADCVEIGLVGGDDRQVRRPQEHIGVRRRVKRSAQISGVVARREKSQRPPHPNSGLNAYLQRRFRTAARFFEPFNPARLFAFRGA